MVRYFQVADFRFSIDAADASVWKHLGNYAPFNCENNSRELLFSIEISDVLPQGERSEYFQDKSQESDMPVINVFSQAGGYLFEMSPTGKSSERYFFWSDVMFRHCILQKWDLETGRRFPLDNAAMIMFAMASATENTLAMHASVTVKNGSAYLFLGKSGTGKSTHSRLWIENLSGCSLLNDDNPVVRIMEDGRVVAFGTPWSGKTPCYRNESAPVGAFVNLNQYPENRIRRMSVIESIAAFYMSCSGMRKSDPISDGLDNTIFAIMEKVPCFHLDCLPDANAARLCCSTVTAK